eukprot:SAG31_NODE_27786_length_420_cov_0.800623_1_plen_32_part_10
MLTSKHLLSSIYYAYVEASIKLSASKVLSTAT